MADRWVKLKVSVRENDRVAAAVEAAGVAAWAVYSGLIVLHAEFGSHGRLDTAHSRPTRIRMGLPAFGLATEDVARSLDALEDAGLIVRDGEGSITLVGFDESVMPACSGCGKPNPEPGHSTCPTCRERWRARRRGGRGSNGAPASAQERTLCTHERTPSAPERTLCTHERTPAHSPAHRAHSAGLGLGQGVHAGTGTACSRPASEPPPHHLPPSLPAHGHVVRDQHEGQGGRGAEGESGRRAEPSARGDRRRRPVGPQGAAPTPEVPEPDPDDDRAEGLSDAARRALWGGLRRCPDPVHVADVAERALGRLA